MLTGPKKWIDQCRSLSLHGMDKDAWKRFSKAGSWKYDVPEPGYKYNMTDIMASMGLVQLGKLVDAFEKRKVLAQRYIEKLSANPYIQIPEVSECSSFHIFPIVIDSDQSTKGRDHVVQELKEANIGVSVHYLPIHSFSYYQKKYGWKANDFPVANRVGTNCLTLPLYPALSFEDQDDVIQTLLSIVGV